MTSRFALPTVPRALPPVPGSSADYALHGILASEAQPSPRDLTALANETPVPPTEIQNSQFKPNDLFSGGIIGSRFEDMPSALADLADTENIAFKPHLSPPSLRNTSYGMKSYTRNMTDFTRTMDDYADGICPDGVLLEHIIRHDPLPSRSRERCPPWRTLVANFVRDPGTEGRIAANKICADLQEQYYWLKPLAVLAFLGYLIFVFMLVLRLLRFKGAVEPASNQSADCVWRIACPQNTTCIYDPEMGRTTCKELVSRQWQNEEKANLVLQTLFEALTVGIAICILGILAWMIFPRCLKCCKQAGTPAEELDESRQRKKRTKKYKSFGTGQLQADGTDGGDDVHSMALRILASTPPSSSISSKARKDRKRSKKASRAKSARQRPGKSQNARQHAERPPSNGSSESEDDGFSEFFATREAPGVRTSSHRDSHRDSFSGASRVRCDHDTVSRWSHDVDSDSESGVSVNITKRMASSLHRMQSFKGDVDGASDHALSDAYFDGSGVPNFMGYALQLAVYCDGAGRKKACRAGDSDDSLADLEESSLSELFQPGEWAINV